LRPGLVDHKCAAHELLAIERCDHFLRFSVVANFGESETARLTRKAVAKERQRIRLHPSFREQCLQLLFCCLERKIAHVQFLHGGAPCASRAGRADAELGEAGPRPRAVSEAPATPGWSERSSNSGASCANQLRQSTGARPGGESDDEEVNQFEITVIAQLFP
jgi:hypothetical protein